MFDQLPSPCSATRLQEKGGKTIRGAGKCQKAIELEGTTSELERTTIIGGETHERVLKHADLLLTVCTLVAVVKGRVKTAVNT